MNGYGWRQLGQWDVPPGDAHVKHRSVDTGLSKAVCKYILVKITDQGGGSVRCEYIKESDVTQAMLDEAG